MNRPLSVDELVAVAAAPCPVCGQEATYSCENDRVAFHAGRIRAALGRERWA